MGGHLEERGLTGRFEVIVTRDDVTAGKPDPAPYLEALARLGVPPDEAVAIEDSANGLASATAAGMRAIVVPHGLTAHLDFSAADLVLTSLASLPLEVALARLG